MPNNTEQTIPVSDFWGQLLTLAEEWMPRILVSLLILIIFVFINRILKRAFKKQKMRDESHQYSMTLMLIQKSISVVVFTICILIILGFLGIPVSSAIAVVAALGAAVALALKDNLANLASGIVIIITHPFSLGDAVEVENSTGKVTNIGIIYTTLLTPANTVIYVPNFKLTANRIVNFSANPTRRLDVALEVNARSDIALAKEVLNETVLAEAFVLTEPPPRVEITRQEQNWVELTIFAWCKTENFWDFGYSLRHNAKAALEKAGVERPVPELRINKEIGD